MQISDFKKLSDVLWELPSTYRGDMRVPARVYATEKMLKDMFRDRSLQQLVNVASLPGIVGHALVMPDAHEGYGFPIGGVAATEFADGIIFPGGIGYDINCGVRLLKSQITSAEVEPHLERLGQQLYRDVPSGVGRGGALKLNGRDFDDLLEKGVKWMVQHGYGLNEDIERIESGGSLDNADPGVVSLHAKQRGADQLGTMGAGNHFVEVDRVEALYDDDAARAFGLFKDQIVILIHTGSRGFGHQVATDYIRIMMGAMPKYGIHLPDNELACVPLSSDEGTNYFNAMAAAANFAWANRQMITHEVRQSWEAVLGRGGGQLEILYDVAHNMAKIEKYKVGDAGKGGSGEKKLIIHRKGATRAFGPGHPEITEEYREAGQPVLIPGSMGTASYVLAGTAGAMAESFGSCCHGAGRRMSRHAAMRQVHSRELMDELRREGIRIETGSFRGVAEEAPIAYKDVDEVCEVVHRAGIAKKVARLKPVIVIKG
jgi:tRNA-splicing ligase RtcB (3'-phosphate/5'-hydroxy nucleic acid ligase)